MIRFKKKPKIQVFLRTCFYSSASNHKSRPKGFSHKKCIENLLRTIDPKKASLTILLDTSFRKGKTHFLEEMEQEHFKLQLIDGGSEAKAFLCQLDYALGQDFSDETIIYFVEDDYLHRSDWIDVLKEGINLGVADYVTLYDHQDKYTAKEYADLQAKLYMVKSCHFRSTPSTTNTYAMKASILRRDEAIHRHFSTDVDISKDHDKFCALAKEGAHLISAVPGWSTHLEPLFMSPCYDWEDPL